MVKITNDDVKAEECDDKTFTPEISKTPLHDHDRYSKFGEMPYDHLNDLIGANDNADKTFPCLLADLVDCDEYFYEHEFQGWYDHSLTHFGSIGPPERSLCIFCGTEFVGEDRREVWKNRMIHSWSHLLDGSDFDHSYPDIDVTRYLYKHGKTSRADFEHAMSGVATVLQDSPDWQPR